MTVTDCVALQCDVSVAYLRSELHEELWMYPPKGTPPLPPNPRNGKRRCYRVKRAIYGCKQGSIEWFKTFSKKQFLENGYRQCPFDTCLFIKRSGIFFCIAANYVDDTFVVSNWPEELAAFKTSMRDNFEVTEFNDIKWFLGWHFERDRKAGTCTISQKQFVTDALARFGLTEVHARKQPCPTGHTFEELDETCLLNPARQKLLMEKIGTLNYLSTSSRADISWVVSKLGMYMQQGDEHTMKITDQVFAYLKGTDDHGITIHRSAGLEPVAFSDASHADNGKTSNGRRRSQSGCVVKVAGIGIVSYSRAQKNVALSTMESEYVALSMTVQEVVWVRRLLFFLGFPPKKPTIVYEDNEAAQALANNELMTKRSRFVDARFHYTREMVSEGEVQILRCCTQEMEADLFTKALSAEVATKFWDRVRGKTFSPLQQG